MSQSLDRAAARELEQVPRIDLAKAVLKNERLNLLPRFDRDFDLAAFTFGPNVLEISARREQGNTNSTEAKKVSVADFRLGGSIAGAKPATAVGDALRDVVTRKRGQPLAGVLLVTDGANNTGAQPLESAAALRQEGVPVYVYGVGITSPRDIIVANLFAPDVTFVKDEAVTVRVRAQGLKNETRMLSSNSATKRSPRKPLPSPAIPSRSCR